MVFYQNEENMNMNLTLNYARLKSKSLNFNYGLEKTTMQHDIVLNLLNKYFSIRNCHTTMHTTYNNKHDESFNLNQP